MTSTSTVTGQGSLPIYRCMVTHDDASVASPTWNDYTARVRHIEVDRGRSSELSAFDAGTAQVVFDNRDRALDPAVNANVRPMNRLWLMSEFSGSRRGVFFGYAEAWQSAWDPSGSVDATITMECADELKVLALDALPVTDPPRDSYSALVASDGPEGYWPFNDDPSLRTRIGFSPPEWVPPDLVDPEPTNRAERRAMPAKRLRRPGR